MSSNTRKLIRKLVVSLSRLGRAFFSEIRLLVHPAILYSRKCRFSEIRVYQLPAFSWPYLLPDLNPILSQLFCVCYLLCSLLVIFRRSKIRRMDADAELPAHGILCGGKILTFLLGQPGFATNWRFKFCVLPNPKVDAWLSLCLSLPETDE